MYKTIKTDITPKDNNRKSKCPEKEIQIRPYNIANTKIFKIILTYSKIKKCRKHIIKLLIIISKLNNQTSCKCPLATNTDNLYNFMKKKKERNYNNAIRI